MLQIQSNFSSLWNAFYAVVFLGFTSLLIGSLGLGFTTNNTFTNNFKARTNNFSPNIPSSIYPVVCGNLTLGNETKTFSGTTELRSICGEPPDQCSEFICNGDLLCELVKADGAQCAVSSDCPGYKTGEICDPDTCTCFQLEIGSGGPNIILDQEEGNVNYTFGLRFRNFGGAIQNIFVQRNDQPVALWDKFNYNWALSQTHSININWNTITRILTTSVVPEDNPASNIEIKSNFSDLVDFNPIDSFQFISVARSGQQLIFDEPVSSSQYTSPITYPGTPTFVNYYFLDVLRPGENFVFSGTLYLFGGYVGQETSKVEIAWGESLPLTSPLIVSDFFIDVNLTNPEEINSSDTTDGTTPGTDFATSPPPTDFPTGTGDLPTALPTDVPTTNPTEFATTPPTDLPTGTGDLPTALPTDFGGGTTSP